MRWLNQLGMQVRMLLFRRNAVAQLDEELRFHLEQLVKENLAAGMGAEEARQAALRKFGNTESLRETTGATWSWNGLEQFVQVICIGARTLRRTPGFAIIAILITALGIGACVALFTVVRDVLLKPLPFKDPTACSCFMSAVVIRQTTGPLLATRLPAAFLTHGTKKTLPSAAWPLSKKTKSVFRHPATNCRRGSIAQMSPGPCSQLSE